MPNILISLVVHFISSKTLLVIKLYNLAVLILMTFFSVVSDEGIQPFHKI